MRLRTMACMAASVLIGSAVGCKDDDTAKPAKTKPRPAASTPAKLPLSKLPSKVGKRKPARRGDVSMALVAVALRQPGLAPEQRTKIEALKAKEDGSDGSPGVDRDAFRDALVSSLTKGKEDEAAFDGLEDSARRAREQRRARRAKRIDAVHAILEPPQRKALAASVRQRLDGSDGKNEGEDKGGARVIGPGKITPRLIDTGRRDQLGGLRLIDRGGSGAGSGREGMSLSRMAAGLDLTDDQQKKLDELMKKVRADRPAAKTRRDRREAARKDLLALMKAFEKDDFEAGKQTLFGPRPDDGAWLNRHRQRFAAFLAILTAQQRTELAKRFEDHGIVAPRTPPAYGVDAVVREMQRTPPAAASSSAPSPAASKSAAPASSASKSR